MALEILPFTADRIAAVRAFNERLAADGVHAEQRFPETPDPGLDARHGAFRGRRRRRGARRLHSAAAELPGRANRCVAAAHYRLPLSEGLIDRTYSTLGLRLVRDALAREPRLYAMGMGGWDNPLPQMLEAPEMADERGAVLLQSGAPGTLSAQHSRAAHVGHPPACAWMRRRPPARAGPG